jgi:hypothetical protein
MTTTHERTSAGTLAETKPGAAPPKRGWSRRRRVAVGLAGGGVAAVAAGGGAAVLLPPGGSAETQGSDQTHEASLAPDQANRGPGVTHGPPPEATGPLYKKGAVCEWVNGSPRFRELARGAAQSIGTIAAGFSGEAPCETRNTGDSDSAALTEGGVSVVVGVTKNGERSRITGVVPVGGGGDTFCDATTVYRYTQNGMLVTVSMELTDPAAGVTGCASTGVTDETLALTDFVAEEAAGRS